MAGYYGFNANIPFTFQAIKHLSAHLTYLCSGPFCNFFGDFKQLLDEVEHDIMNYQNQGLCYLPKPKAEEDNTDTRDFEQRDFEDLVLF